jgi:hypothetical protein
MSWKGVINLCNDEHVVKLLKLQYLRTDKEGVFEWVCAFPWDLED